MNIDEKCAEILVECGYADGINGDHMAHAYPCGADGSDVGWEFRPCEPFSDTLEGRRQADAIEQYLYTSKYGTWGISIGQLETSGEYETQHKWRLARIKWCLEKLVKDDE